MSQSNVRRLSRSSSSKRWRRTRPRLANHVRTLRIIDCWRSTISILKNQPLGCGPLLGMMSLLGKCFKSLTRLIALSMDLEGSCGRIFHGCTFQLLEVYLGFPLDCQLGFFLNGRLQIRILTFQYLQDITCHFPTFTSASLPHLSVLRAQWPIVACLAPGRPLSRVDIHYIVEDDRIYTNAIPALTTARLSHLNLTGPTVDVQLLFEAISTYVPRLIELRVITTSTSFEVRIISPYLFYPFSPIPRSLILKQLDTRCHLFRN
jgi:hypothetical protein